MSQFDDDYERGRRLVDEQIRRNAHLSTYDLFRLSWRVINENEDMFKGRAGASGFDQKAWRVFVHHDLGKYFLRMRPDFIPPVRALEAPPKGAVIVTVHTGLELGIVRALLARNVKLSVIHLPNPRNRERATIFKPPPEVQYITADANCLLNARRALQLGRSILADCDHPVDEDVRATSIRAIRGSLFETAKRADASLYFVLPYVDTHGQIAFRTELLPQPLNRAVDYRLHFISFLKRSGLDWIEWRTPGS